MAGNTKTYSVTDAADVGVVALGFTQFIRVGEDPSVLGWPTTDFVVKKPAADSDPIQKIAGASYTFSKRDGGFYSKGEVAGYIRTISGTTTFQHDERGT